MKTEISIEKQNGEVKIKTFKTKTEKQKTKTERKK